MIGTNSVVIRCNKTSLLVVLLHIFKFLQYSSLVIYDNFNK